MARNLQSKSPTGGHNSSAMIDAEAADGYISRAEEAMRQQKHWGEVLKGICAEADEAGALTKKEVRRHARERFMDPEILQAQLDRDAMIRAARAALTHLVGSPLGDAAIAEATQPKPGRRSKAADALDKAATHLNGSGIPDAEIEAARRDPAGAGREAAARGFTETRNPFGLGSSESAQWVAGFKNATDERHLSEGAASSPYEDNDLPPA